MTRAAAGVPPRRPWWLIGLGVLAALLIAVATLPASLITNRLAPYGVQTLSVHGTVWSAQAAGVSWRGVPLGDLHWRATPSSVLRGALGARVTLQRPDGRVETLLEAGLGSTITLRDLTLDLPIELLLQLPLGLPPGWSGRLTAQIEQLRIAGGWPVEATGVVTAANLMAARSPGTPMGSYRLELPHPDIQGADGELNARVTSIDGPFDVDARLALNQDRSFVLEGNLRARGGLPPHLQRSLEMLGPADAEGRRPFSVAGTL